MTCRLQRRFLSNINYNVKCKNAQYIKYLIGHLRTKLVIKWKTFDGKLGMQLSKNKKCFLVGSLNINILCVIEQRQYFVHKY